jgi:F-type H+-transporting ATPase subunit delta
MTESKIARRYGHALFNLAHAQKVEQSVWDDLVTLRQALEKDPRFLGLLAAPQIPDEDKRTLTRSVLTGVAQPILRNFVLFLIDRRRSDYLLDIIADYGLRLDELQGVVAARITSAVPLTDDELKTIIVRLERISGKTVRHTLEVDPAILGGVIVIIGGEIIDHSVRHDLMRLRDSLRAIKVHQAA